MFKITKTVLDGTSKVPLPTGKTVKELSQDFSDFFIAKVEKTAYSDSISDETNVIQTEEKQNHEESNTV